MGYSIGYLEEDDVGIMLLDEAADGFHPLVDGHILPGPDVVGHELDLPLSQGLLHEIDGLIRNMHDQQNIIELSWQINLIQQAIRVSICRSYHRCPLMSRPVAIATTTPLEPREHRASCLPGSSP